MIDFQFTWQPNDTDNIIVNSASMTSLVVGEKQTLKKKKNLIQKNNNKIQLISLSDNDSKQGNWILNLTNHEI